MDGDEAVVWVDSSSLVIGAVQEVNGNIAEDVCWLRQKESSHINLDDLNDVLRGVNLVVFLSEALPVDHWTTSAQRLARVRSDPIY